MKSLINDYDVVRRIYNPQIEPLTGTHSNGATALYCSYDNDMKEYPTGSVLAIREINDRSLMVPGQNYVIETSEYIIVRKLQSSETPGRIKACSTNMETYPDGQLMHEPLSIPLEKITRMYLVLAYMVKQSN